MKLPDRNLLDGSKTPVTSTAEMKKAQGDQRDFVAALLGTDSDDKPGARATLEVPSVTDEQSGKSRFAIADGTGDAMTVTFSPAIVELVEGMELKVRCKAANSSGSPTLKVNNLDPLTITAADGTTLPPGSYVAGWPATFRYRAAATPAPAKLELLNPVVLIPSASPEVRQTVLQGVTTSGGAANMLSAGSGRALNLSATAMPMRTAFSQAAADYIATLSEDKTGVVSGIAVNNLSYITQDYVGPTSVTWGATLAPVQCGYAYNQAAQALLHFNGTAGATAILDDFGNVWSAQGGAKLQTNQSKFGSAALGGAGVNNAMNGTSDHVSSTSFTTMGSGSWSLRAFGYLTSLSSARPLFSFENGSAVGVLLRINTAGKTEAFLSSTGSSWDIASSSTGSATLAAGQFYFIELTFDAVAGKYFVYVNGVVDNTITSSAKVCSGFSTNYIGREGSTYWAGYIDEFEFLPYCDHPAGTTYAVPTAAASVATPGYASDFYSIPNRTMYQVSAASSGSGVNPSFAAKNRVYVAECVASANSISSVINYALCGRFESAEWPVAAGSTAITHAIGVTPRMERSVLVCKDADGQYAIGDEILISGLSSSNANPYVVASSAVSRMAVWIVFNTGLIDLFRKSDAGWQNLTASKWRIKTYVQRGF